MKSKNWGKKMPNTGTTHLKKLCYNKNEQMMNGKARQCV